MFNSLCGGRENALQVSNCRRVTDQEPRLVLKSMLCLPGLKSQPTAEDCGDMKAGPLMGDRSLLE